MVGGLTSRVAASSWGARVWVERRVDDDESMSRGVSGVEASSALDAARRMSSGSVMEAAGAGLQRASVKMLAA